jgi:hypothetical protein
LMLLTLPLIFMIFTLFFGAIDAMLSMPLMPFLRLSLPACRYAFRITLTPLRCYADDTLLMMLRLLSPADR